MDENVAKAVGEVDLRFTSGNAVPVERASVRDHEWQTIRARLVELEAENERLRAGLADNGCAVVYEALDAFSGETSGPWVRNIRAEQVESTAKQFAEAVRREAFKMPPPNEWTPVFVMLANEADHRITAHLSENGHE